MRKLISAVLSLVMLLGSLVIPEAVFAAEEEKIKEIGFIVDEKFDDVHTDGFPSTFKKAESNTAVSVQEYPSKTDKSLKFDIKSTAAISIDNVIDRSTDDVIIEFELTFENICMGQIRFAYKNNAAKEANFFDINRGLKMQLPTGENVFNFAPGKKYRFCIAMSPSESIADYYVNHRKVANDVKISNTNAEDLTIFRIYIRDIASADMPVFYMDNFRIYNETTPIFKYENMGYTIGTGTNTSLDYVAEDEAVYEYMGDAVAMYVNQSKMYSHSEVSYIDKDNKEAAPFVVNGTTLVPIRAISDGFDAYIRYDDATKTAFITGGDSDIEVTADKSEFKVDGRTVALREAARIVDGRMYLPLRAVCEAFGKKLSYDKSGLIVIADRENFFNMQADLCIFRALAGMLVFHQPTGYEMVATVKARYPDKGHPRLFADSAEIERLRKEVKENDLKAKWFKSVIDVAERYLDTPLTEYVYNSSTYHIPVDPIVEVIKTESFAYQMTGDKRYAERCLAEMKNVAAWPNWNEEHSFLDTATAMGTLARGYDWIYDYMSDSDRTLIQKAIVDKGMFHVMQDYTNAPRKRLYSWAQSPVPDNWSVVCNAGAIAAALALADVEEELCADVLDYGLEHVEDAVLMYGPDGAWYEGPGYWGYTTRYYVQLMSCLDTALGDTYGYMDVPGIADTGYYITALNGPAGTFNFHDAEPGISTSNELIFLANMLGDGALSDLRINQLVGKNQAGSIDTIMWYNPELSGGNSRLTKDSYYRDTEVAVMRDGYEDGSIYAAIHSGKINVYHGQYDAGQFIIDGYGTRYVCDLGLENYATPGAHDSKYRNRSEGHNTLVINPGLDAGQDLKASPKIDRFESDDASAFAITDLSSAYAKDVVSAKRGMSFTDNRSKIIVQDEIKSNKANDIWWFMHSRQPIEVSADGKSALIKGNTRNLKVSLMADVPGKFTVMAATPMETSPVNNAQNKNALYTKLALHLENTKDVTIPVQFEFVLPIYELEPISYEDEVVPLDEWKLTGEGLKELPSLDDIIIKGKSIEGFDPDKLDYSYSLDSGEKMPKIEAVTDAKVDIEYVEGTPGYAIAKLTSSEGITNSYVIKFVNKPYMSIPDGVSKIDISAVSASAVPEAANIPENTLDGDLNTRWSAMGREYITYDLGDIKDISFVGLAIYQDTKKDGRKQYFDILLSDDGESYTTIFSGETTGTTLEEEVFAIKTSKARYVRIQCYGSSVSDWNSITECSIYSK